MPAASWLVLSAVAVESYWLKGFMLEFVVQSAKTTDISLQYKKTNLKMTDVCFITFFTAYLETEHINYSFQCLKNLVLVWADVVLQI